MTYPKCNSNPYRLALTGMAKLLPNSTTIPFNHTYDALQQSNFWWQLDKNSSGALKFNFSISDKIPLNVNAKQRLRPIASLGALPEGVCSMINYCQYLNFKFPMPWRVFSLIGIINYAKKYHLKAFSGCRREEGRADEGSEHLFNLNCFKM